MKALSIKQPWAWAICNLPEKFRKDVENRNWVTKYRGDFLVHASKGFDSVGYERMCDYLATLGYDGYIPTKKEFVHGALVGVTTLNRVLKDNNAYYHQSDSIWFEGEYGFELINTYAFENPISYKGRLNFFNVDNELVREEMEKAIYKGKTIDDIPEYKDFKVGDVVTCRVEAFDVFTKLSKVYSGHSIFKTKEAIQEIKDDLCRFDNLGIGYSWYSKKELSLVDEVL